MRLRILAVELNRLLCCTVLGLSAAAVSAQTNPPPRPDLDATAAVDMTSVPASNHVDTSHLPFTTDTQVRLMGLFEPAGTNSPVQPVATESNEPPYLAIEGVPLRSVFKLLARAAGLNYLDPAADQIPEEDITVQMAQPKPRDLMDFLLKHRGLELFDGGTGLYTVRKYTNQLAFYRFKLKDNFIDRFKGGAQSAPTGGAGSYSGAGNAVSASAGSLTVENGGKYGEIEPLLEKVANVGDEKNNKIWYYEEKQQVLLYGTRMAADRISQYLEIANAKNPNVRIDVRIFATSSNPMSQMGVDWASLLSPGLTFGLMPPGGSAAGTNSFSGMSNLRQLASTFGNPMSSVVLRNDISATLNFFVNDQKGETVAQPSTITANGREVAFAATQQIPYISGSSVAVGYSSTGSGVGYDNTSFVNVGTTINILPRIQDGVRLKLGTAISVSQLDQFVTISSGTQGTPPRQVPQTSGRAFNGEFTVDSGDTVVIAGLRTSTSSKSRNKVPYLGDIPGLGKLFRNEQNKKDVNYLTIFITATILDDHNQPKIPPGTLKPEDSQPDEENTLSAEANSNFLLRKTSWTDKALVHARKQALEARTAEANKVVAQRIDAEKQLDELTRQATTNAEAVRQLEQEHRAQLQREGAIDSIPAFELETKLTKAKANQEKLLGNVENYRDNVERLKQDEAASRAAVEQAEAEYTAALKGSVAVPTNKQAPEVSKPMQTSQPPRANPSTNSHSGELEENARLLDQLK
jgi:type II secretory pathway component GspD/PulD (secretin)